MGKSKNSWKPHKKSKLTQKKNRDLKKKVPHGSLLTLWQLVRYFFLLGLVDYICIFIVTESNYCMMKQFWQST